MVLSIVARILSAAVSIYMLMCTVRILMTWVPGIDTGRGGELLRSTTDPYLRFFSRFRLMRSGKFDFSPIVALAVLAVANQLFATLAYTGRVTLGIALGLVVGAAWSAVAFVLSFVAVCALVRVIAYAARWNSLHPLWMVVDSMLNPILYRINRTIYRGRIVNYLQGLVTGFIVLIALRVAGGGLVNLIIRLLDQLPI
ncbi:MAG TPA: YggT family protein [Rectinemataceae bacterium]|nr:YggT family protein [Rectinemataceae bacterium]